MSKVKKKKKMLTVSLPTLSATVFLKSVEALKGKILKDLELHVLVSWKFLSDMADKVYRDIIISPWAL